MAFELNPRIVGGKRIPQCVVFGWGENWVSVLILDFRKVINAMNQLFCMVLQLNKLASGAL